MSVQSATVPVPPPVAIPRGAEWASALVGKLVRSGHSVWRGLETVGQARAQRDLQRQGVKYERQPELASTLRDAMHRAAMHRDCQH